MSNKSRSLGSTIVAIVFTLIVLGATAWVVTNRQFVLDQLNVWWYQPTTSITSLSNRSGMSDTGRFYLYASQPQIESATDFNVNCVRQEVSSAILGCYSAQRIYIYDVTNNELDGVEDVTASHEMLHAVWERMSSGEKQSVGALLESAFVVVNDPKLNERMAYYDRTEPGERNNELHSILGTEYSNLGGKLEAYYGKYFTSRTKVVTLHNSYQSKFDSLKDQSDVLRAELATLKKAISDQSGQYNTEAASVSIAAEDLKKQYDKVDRTSSSEVKAYNAQRQVLLNRIAALDSLRAQINAETDAYNQKVTQYNSIVVTTNELNSSLDSTLVTAPSL
ncbi:hypothetical protein BH10PAT4_BH10PAT4_2170 [soil metagenome]